MAAEAVRGSAEAAVELPEKVARGFADEVNDEPCAFGKAIEIDCRDGRLLVVAAASLPRAESVMRLELPLLAGGSRSLDEVAGRSRRSRRSGDRCVSRPFEYLSS